jgi:hypothetical protein
MTQHKTTSDNMKHVDLDSSPMFKKSANIGTEGAGPLPPLRSSGDTLRVTRMWAWAPVGDQRCRHHNMKHENMKTMRQHGTT